uniref:hypothetical protein n=1 Tax=Timspurckia oligopyrenoides TaxID=708627 RepID=UPI001FCD2572|nr:hypothetical protein MW591_pgp152 [Timspurckia oligopyrenoides]UNJ17463.1 hypothetical protein [Timspurckia oligopyrenoides]
MCVCINCLYINSCSIYHIIEKNHKQHSKRVKPLTFHPVEPILNINLYLHSNDINIDWDLVECLSFIESPGVWLDKIKIKE